MIQNINWFEADKPWETHANRRGSSDAWLQSKVPMYLSRTHSFAFIFYIK